jgi:hypothetical protein
MIPGSDAERNDQVYARMHVLKVERGPFQLESCCRANRFAEIASQWTYYLPPQGRHAQRFQKPYNLYSEFIIFVIIWICTFITPNMEIEAYISDPE